MPKRLASSSKTTKVTKRKVEPEPAWCTVCALGHPKLADFEVMVLCFWGKGPITTMIIHGWQHIPKPLLHEITMIEKNYTGDEDQVHAVEIFCQTLSGCLAENNQDAQIDGIKCTDWIKQIQALPIVVKTLGSGNECDHFNKSMNHTLKQGFLMF